MAEKKLLVGIDLGTTNSAIAYVRELGAAECIPNSEGERTTPSVVQIHADGSFLVGDDAKSESVLESERTAAFFKRDMGRQIVYNFGGIRLSPVDLSAAVLCKLKADAETHLGRSIDGAVVTVPAYFRDPERVATVRACEQAELQVLQTVNEPTAAAINYGVRKCADQETVLIYDLGGGTFDVSLVHMSEDSINVLMTDGDHQLGGKDWDDVILQYLCHEFEKEHGLDPRDNLGVLQDLCLRAEAAKKSLSLRTSVVVPVSYDGAMSRITITREDFASLTRYLLLQTEEIITRLLESANMEPEHITRVLMVGASTRMPMCAELIESRLGIAPDAVLNPDECVALGAAILAHQRYGVSGQLTRKAEARSVGMLRSVNDVTGHSLGMIAVSADGERYINSILLQKNLPIPCSETRPYQTVIAGSDDHVIVYVTQGESEDPRHCSLVGRYRISGLAGRPGTKTTLDISYSYDQSGIVAVTAKQRDSGSSLLVRKEDLPDDMSWVNLPPPTPTVEPTSICIAIDLSGSMAGDPLQKAKDAIGGFVRGIDLTHMRMSTICFADRSKIDQALTNDGNRVLRAIRDWEVGTVGIGNETDPFGLVHDVLASQKGRRCAVILTDGVWSYQAKAAERAGTCREAGIDIIAIGFGGADERFLQQISTSDDLAVLTKLSDLPTTFGHIAQVITESAGTLVEKDL